MKSTVSDLELKAAARTLPPSPQIFGKLSRLLKKPETDVPEISNLVNTDGSLAGQVIRISNGTAYNNGDPIESVEEAINRIGFHELFKIVGIAACELAPVLGIDSQPELALHRLRCRILYHQLKDLRQTRTAAGEIEIAEHKGLDVRIEECRCHSHVISQQGHTRQEQKD